MKNWCEYFVSTQENINNIAYYTHLVPIFVLFIIGIYAFAQKQKEARSFTFFILFFIVWLIGDLITWISTDIHLIVTLWSILDFVEILTFLSALNFLLTLIKIEKLKKIVSWIMLVLAIPAFYIAIRGLSILSFDHSVCEAVENNFLISYKIISNITVMMLIVMLAFLENRFLQKEKSVAEQKKVLWLVGGSLLLLLLAFSINGYISSNTGIYEIELFGLFTIPVFIVIIVFSISRLNLFNLKLWSQQLIAYVLVILVASELFFTKNIVGIILTAITVVMSILFVVILTRSIKKESEARQQLNILNTQLSESNKKLKELDEQKTEFISLASHQLRGPLTAIKGYASMLLEGDFGQLSPHVKEAMETIYRSTQALVVIVGDYLDITRIEQGKMKYDFVDFDLKDLVKTVITEVGPNVSFSHLSLEFSFDESKTYMVRADQGKIKQVISNLIDNSIKYTKEGGIKVGLEINKRSDILISIKDTGVGIEPEVLPRLFEKFSRAPDASKANIMGTGLGLYVARKIMEAHRGKVWAESEGKNKGATFFIELEPINPLNRPNFKEIDGNLSKEDNLEGK